MTVRGIALPCPSNFAVATSLAKRDYLQHMIYITNKSYVFSCNFINRELFFMGDQFNQ